MFFSDGSRGTFDEHETDRFHGAIETVANKLNEQGQSL